MGCSAWQSSKPASAQIACHESGSGMECGVSDVGWVQPYAPQSSRAISDAGAGAIAAQRQRDMLVHCGRPRI